MRLSELLGPDLEHEPEELREALERVHLEDIAELIEDIPENQGTSLLRLLEPEVGAEVLGRLSLETQRSASSPPPRWCTPCRPMDRLPGGLSAEVLLKYCWRR